MLRGASADALGELSATALKGGGSAELGDQLFGVAAILRGEPALRRALTDSAVEAKAREGLASAVFGSSVGGDTLALVTDAVQRRWTASVDLAEAVDHLAVVSTVRSAGDDAEKVGDELFAVGELVGGSQDLRSALTDPARTLADRAGMLTGLLEGKVLPATASLVSRAVTDSQLPLDATLASYQEIAAGVRGERLAVVRTARELSPADQDRLAAALGQQYDATVHLHVVVEPALVGGLRVEIGDDVIDGSVSGRLDDARRRLAG